MDEAIKSKLLELYAEACDKAKNSTKNGKDLIFVPAICGKNYANSVKRVMVVGRAPNGWSMGDYPNNGCAPEAWFEYGLSWVYQDGPASHKRSVAHSKFWQFIRYKLVENGIIESKENFSDNIVWTNLYKISPKIHGNPSGNLRKITAKLMDDILCNEINYYQPDEIWFITKNNKKPPEDGDKDLWFRKKHFENAVCLVENQNNFSAILYNRPEFCSFYKVKEKAVCLSKR